MRVAYAHSQSHPTYSSSTKRLVEPFVREVSKVFGQLELLIPNGNGPTQDTPAPETVDWAKQVLLRVLPRKFLIGAEINAFQREIHVAWESDERGKRVVVFFPGPSQIKIYHELVKDDAVEEHKLVNASSPDEISTRLRWFFQ
jgi:hypothetical protein